MTATEPDAVVAKPGRKWLRRLIVLALIAGTVAVYMDYRTRMSTLKLPDGRTFHFLQSTLAGAMQQHSLGTSAKERVARALSELQGKPNFTQLDASVTNDRDIPTVAFWFQSDGPWTQQDMETKSIIFTDTNGWAHRGSYFIQYRGGTRSTGLFVQTPAFPEAGQPCRMEVVSKDGEVLGGLNLTLPGAVKPHFAWTAAALPNTQSNGDITVTLARVVPTAPVVSAQLTQNQRYPANAVIYGVTPEFTVQVKEAPSDDWIVATDDDWWQWRKNFAPLRNAYGERGSLKTCGLSPFDDVWRLALPLVKRNSALAADERVTFTCDVPSAGISTSINEEQKIGAASIRLLGVSGTGRSTATSEGTRLWPGGQVWPIIEEKNCRIVMAWTGAMPQPPPGVMTVTYSYGAQDPDSNLHESILCPCTVKLTIDSQVPTVSFSVTPWRFEHLQIDVIDDQGRAIAGDKVRFVEFALWRPRQPLAAGTKSLTIQMSLQEPKQFEFFVTPPRDEIQKQLRANEAQ